MASGIPTIARRGPFQPSHEKEKGPVMTQRFKEKLVDWQVLVDNLTPRLTDMPQLASDHDALAKVVADAHGLENEQETARAAFQKVNQQRRDLAEQGKILHSRLSLSLKGKLNPDSRDLTEFRIKPLKPRAPRRRLTPLQKAERALARAQDRMAAAKAAEQASSQASVVAAKSTAT
jgi:hypothetical protein